MTSSMKIQYLDNTMPDIKHFITKNELKEQTQNVTYSLQGHFLGILTLIVTGSLRNANIFVIQLVH